MTDLRSITLGELVDAIAGTRHHRPEDGYVELRREHRFYRAALAAIRTGELKASKVPGIRAYLIPATEWHAWIRSHEVTPGPRESGPDLDDVDRWIDDCGSKAG